MKKNIEELEQQLQQHLENMLEQFQMPKISNPSTDAMLKVTDLLLLMVIKYELLDLKLNNNGKQQ